MNTEAGRGVAKLLAAAWLATVGACASNAPSGTMGETAQDVNGASGANVANVAGLQGSAGAMATASGAPAASFTEVYEMLFPRMTNAHCDMCHGLPPYDLSNGNLSTGMDKSSAYAALVGQPSTSSMCRGKVLVEPNHPESSLLLEKLLPNPSCGYRMPNGGAALSDTQLEMVRSWIAAGANND